MYSLNNTHTYTHTYIYIYIYKSNAIEITDTNGPLKKSYMTCTCYVINNCARGAQ